MNDCKTTHPIQYTDANSSIESLVLAFGRSDHDVRLVISYAWEYEITPENVREFRLLKFRRATRFQQTELRSMGQLEGRYQATEEKPRAIGVSREKIERRGTRYHAEYCLSDLGCFEFDFEKFQVAKKVLHAVQVADRWFHKDEHGRPVDFYNPFNLRW